MWRCIHPISYRYGSDEIRSVFKKDRWLEYMKKVELELLRSLIVNGFIKEKIDIDAVEKAFKKVEVEDIQRWEKITKHETMAVVSALSEKSRPYGKYIHVGATSNDILDDVMALQISDAHRIVMGKLSKLISLLVEKSCEMSKIPILARTHGRAAIPITYGFKFGLFIDELIRIYEVIKFSFKLVKVGKLGGAVGTQVELYPDEYEVEKTMLSSLDLSEASYYTQVIPRDRLTIYLLNLITLSSILDHLANEIRNLQRSGIEEVFEPFSESQVGSSIMPHKRNPVNSEKICGIAKILRSYATGVLENIVLEHERDLTNSSFERCIIPEIFILLDEQLNTMIYIINGLVIDEERALRNIESQEPYIYSDLILQKATLKGADRQMVHRRLRNILLSTATLSKEDLIKKVVEDDYLSKFLTADDLHESMDLDKYIKAAEKRLYRLLHSSRTKGF